MKVHNTTISSCHHVIMSHVGCFPVPIGLESMSQLHLSRNSQAMRYNTQQLAPKLGARSPSTILTDSSLRVPTCVPNLIQSWRATIINLPPKRQKCHPPLFTSQIILQTSTTQRHLRIRFREALQLLREVLNVQRLLSHVLCHVGRRKLRRLAMQARPHTTLEKPE